MGREGRKGQGWGGNGAEKGWGEREHGGKGQGAERWQGRVERKRGWGREGGYRRGEEAGEGCLKPKLCPPLRAFSPCYRDAVIQKKKKNAGD